MTHRDSTSPSGKRKPKSAVPPPPDPSEPRLNGAEIHRRKAERAAAKEARLLERAEKATASVLDVLMTVPRADQWGRVKAKPAGSEGHRFVTTEDWTRDAIRARMDLWGEEWRGKTICGTRHLILSYLVADQRPWQPRKKKKSDRPKQFRPLASIPVKYQLIYQDMLWMVCCTERWADLASTNERTVRDHLTWFAKVGLVEILPATLGEPVDANKVVDYGPNGRMLRVRLELAFADPIVKEWEARGRMPARKFDPNLLGDDDVPKSGVDGAGVDEEGEEEGEEE